MSLSYSYSRREPEMDGIKDSIVAAYWRGQAPESILRSYPSLTLAQIYGAIAFYLSNQPQIDAYLKE